MLKSKAIQQDPVAGQNLLIATSKIVSLARTAVDDPIDPKSHSQDIVKTLHRSSFTPMASTAKDLRWTTSIEDSQFVVPAAFDPVPSTLPLHNEVFGNGWFGLQPAILSHLSTDNADMTALERSFGIRLVQSTLSLAYEYLLDDSGSFDNYTREIYRYALLYHSREELLFTARWLLGPGFNSSAYALGKAVFGCSTALSLEYVKAVHAGLEPRFLNPLVDAQALVEAQEKVPVTHFMNAFTIVDYIVGRGAFYIDQDVIQMRVADAGASQIGVSSSTAFPNYLNVNQRSLANTLLSSRVSVESVLPNITVCESSYLPSSTEDPWNAYGSNYISEDRDNIVPGMASTEDQKHQIHTLSVPIFLQSLAKRGYCLGTGPGFPTKAVDQAIVISTIATSHR